MVRFLEFRNDIHKTFLFLCEAASFLCGTWLIVYKASETVFVPSSFRGSLKRLFCAPNRPQPGPRPNDRSVYKRADPVAGEVPGELFANGVGYEEQNGEVRVAIRIFANIATLFARKEVFGV